MVRKWSAVPISLSYTTPTVQVAGGEASFDLLQREASESPRSIQLPPALLAQRRAVLKQAARADEGSKTKANNLILKYGTPLGPD
jgi:hypothetical protein